MENEVQPENRSTVCEDLRASTLLFVLLDVFGGRRLGEVRPKVEHTEETRASRGKNRVLVGF